jgi:hypothetical protein
MLEKNIEEFLKDNIKKLGGLCYKFVSPGNSGVPDRIIFLPNGRLIFVELKTKKGEPSKLQKIQIKRLRKLGQDVRVLYGMEEVKEFLNAIANN